MQVAGIKPKYDTIMLFFRCLISSLLLIVFSLLSCSSDSAYPYTTLKDDPYKTRLYRLPRGVKLYIARMAERPRMAAALCMPSVASDTLNHLYESSVYSSDYRLLFAQIGSNVSSVTDCDGSVVVYNDIPSNELENWAVIMQGSFSALPDSLSIILFGDVVYDEAVATLSRSFSEQRLYTSSSASCTDNANSILPYVRGRFLNGGSGEKCRKMVNFSDVRPNVKSHIKLLESPPAKVLFPDTDRLNISSASKQPKMIVAENSDTLYTFILRTRLKKLPPSMLTHIKDYYSTSLSDKKDSSAPVTHIKIDKHVGSIEFSLTGCFRNMHQDVSCALSMWKRLADGDKFYKYLLANNAAVQSSKINNENIALQASYYAAGGKRLCGMREIAMYSMNALFSQSSEMLFCGKNADKAYSLLHSQLNGTASLQAADFSAVGDSAVRILLLPADIDNVTTITLRQPFASVEDFAAMALFNKAVALSNASPATRFYPNGALLSTGTDVPFVRAAFDAAKSYLLYECSTRGNNGVSLIEEYLFSRERGYGSSQLYDALISLSFSDVKDFYLRHSENPDTQLIISRESNLNLRELKTRDRVVYLTFDELFGY